MNLFLIDVGGTNIRLAKSDGRRLQRVLTTNTPPTWAETECILSATRAEFFGRQKITRTIVGVAGMVDAKHILTLPNLAAWSPAVVTARLKRLCASPVTFENDAVLNGLGEAMHGAGKRSRIVGFVTVSTGINGIRVVDGQPDVHAFPVELRHLLVSHQGVETTLGRAISGRALELRHKKPARLIRTTAVWQAATDTLAEALVNLGLIWTPDVIVLGGSVMKSISIVALAKAVRGRWHHRLPPPPLKKGTLGHLSGLYGGLVLAKQTK